MIDIQNKTNMLNRGHIVVQLRGHSSCVVTVLPSLEYTENSRRITRKTQIIISAHILYYYIQESRDR